MFRMRRRRIEAAAGVVLALALGTAQAQVQAQAVHVDIGLSARTGVAPLVLAKSAGIFERHRLDVVLHELSQKDLALALAAGGVQCGAATADAWIVWNGNGVAAQQIFAIDRSAGADALVARPGIAKVADLKGRTIAAGPVGSATYFELAWLLSKNGLSIRDVRVFNLEPQTATAAFATGTDLDATVSAEPFLSQLRDRPDLANFVATTGDAWTVADTFGCSTRFLAGNAGTARALAESFFEALEMIRRDPQKSFALMGAEVRQSAEQFEASQKNVRWQDRAANRRYFGREHMAFAKEAGDLLLDLGLIKQAPDPTRLVDSRFVP
jgi:NitT/TauT family transport system substrate-binding protein